MALARCLDSLARLLVFLLRHWVRDHQNFFCRTIVIFSDTLITVLGCCLLNRVNLILFLHSRQSGPVTPVLGSWNHELVNSGGVAALPGTTRGTLAMLGVLHTLARLPLAEHWLLALLGRALFISLSGSAVYWFLCNIIGEHRVFQLLNFSEAHWLRGRLFERLLT